MEGGSGKPGRGRLGHDHELLGGAGHGDVAVDSAPGLRVHEHHEVELEPLGEGGGQRADPVGAGVGGVADHAADPVRMRGLPVGHDLLQVGDAAVDDGESAAADRDRHVGVGQRGPDHRLGLGHHLRRGPVVDAERGDPDVGQPDARQPLLPGLGEAAARLRAVADDGEAAGGTAQQQHLPLGVGELLGLVDHDVGEGPGEQVGVGTRHDVRVVERGLQVLAAQHRHQLHLGVVVGDQLVDDVGHLLAPLRQCGLPPRPPAPGTRIAQPLPGRVEQRQVGGGPGTGVLPLQGTHLLGRQPGCAHPQVGRHGPQVTHEVERVEERPGLVEGPVQLPGEATVTGEPAAQQVVRDLRVVGDLVEQDLDERFADVLTGVVVGGARVDGLERLGPVGGAQPQVGPRGLDLGPGAGQLLVERHRRLDRAHQVGRGLQRRHRGVRLVDGDRALGDEVAQGAGLHPVLPEAGQHVGDVGEVGPVRPDEQHPAAPVTEPRVGVEQVRRAVQRHHGLARARTPVHDQRTARARADDGVLVGLDGAQHVAHPPGAAAAEAGQEGGLVVEGGGVPGEPLGGEDLVPVVGDPAVGPAVAAAAGQAQGGGVGGREERFGGRGPPVDEQPATRAVAEAEPTDVHRLAVLGVHPAQAEVEAKSAQGA